jgi:methionyl-tRNA formyltransferase
MKIYSISPVGNSNANPEEEVGSICTDGKSYIHVCCGSGKVALDEIQLAGKKRMKVKEFLLGFRNIEKYRFLL